VMWLTCRLIPDHKTIADFRKDSGPAIKQVCVQFIELCRQMGLLATASIAIDGSKFKAVNTRDKNFTRGKVERRREAIWQRPGTAGWHRTAWWWMQPGSNRSPTANSLHAGKQQGIRRKMA
jgi:hypothetical protein